MMAYYRLLGVERIFAWYEPDVAQNATRWTELRTTTSDYLTLLPMTDDPHESSGTKKYHNQQRAEQKCLTRYARQYDWALFQDADEFFWWSQRGNLVDFFIEYEQYDYISLGKYMYTMKHRYHETKEDTALSSTMAINAMTDPHQYFRVEAHPFTPGSYCYLRRGDPHCPTWIGRSKVFLRPGRHQRVGVHGDVGSLRKPGAIHLPTSVAHLKEWVLLHSPALRADGMVHNTTESFLVDSTEEIRTYAAMQAHNLTEDGRLEVKYDPEVREWMSFVVREGLREMKTGRD